MEIKLESKTIHKCINATTVALKTDNYLIKENKKGLIINNSYEIKIGSKLDVTIADYKTYYIVNYINKINNVYLLKEYKSLIQNYFLLPAVADTKILNSPYFINSYKYITDENWEDTDDLIYLVYRFSPSKGFENLDNNLKSLPNYINKIIDDRFNIYIFKILPRFSRYVSLYTNNKVNEIDQVYNKLILDSFKLVPWNKYIELHKGNSIFKLLTNEPLLREEMSKELGWNIPKNIQLIEKPTKELLTWKKI
jgi:hypothetical protein